MLRGMSHFEFSIVEDQADVLSRYIKGFAITTVWMALIGVLGPIMAYMVKKYPIIAPDPDAIVAAEIQKQRARGVQL